MKPRTEIQKIVYERYQRARAIKKEMEPISASAMARKYGVCHDTITAIGETGQSTKLSPDVCRQIQANCAKYAKLKDEWKKDNAQQMSREYGMTPRTVYNYGVGKFGTRDSPNKMQITTTGFCPPAGVMGFLTMRLTRCPAESVPGYY